MSRVMFLVDSRGVLLGRCIPSWRGWRFHPHTTSHKASRKDWPNAAACIPKWAFDASDNLLTAEEWKSYNKQRAK